jgi:hypothetical protein
VAALFATLSLFGCGDKEVAPSKTKNLPITREESRVAAQAITKQVIVSGKINNKVVDLRPLVKRKKGDVIVRRKVSDFYALHLGLPDVKDGVLVPDDLRVSFDANLATLWHKKVSREEVSGATLTKVPQIIERYLSSPRGYTTLPKFVSHTNTVVANAKKSLNWDGICKKYGLGSVGCRTLQEIVARLHGKDFIAYGMTELFPENAELNVRFLDFMLRNAGVSYIMHIPAAHDNMLSLGFYQFTSLAVGKTDKGTGGATVINEFVKPSGLKIPGSVSLLSGDDHHVAAVYFAVYNLAQMMSRLSDKGIAVLASKHKDFQDEMVMFIASAHHLPAPAWRATASWVEDGMQGHISRAYPKSLKLYALKTHKNLYEIYRGS